MSRELRGAVSELEERLNVFEQVVNLDELRREYATLEAQANEGTTDWKVFERCGRLHSHIQGIEHMLNASTFAIEYAHEVLSDSAPDASEQQSALDEATSCLAQLQKNLRQTLFTEVYDDHGAYITFDMLGDHEHRPLSLIDFTSVYLAAAQERGWTAELVDVDERQVVLKVDARISQFVYGYLKSEQGRRRYVYKEPNGNRKYTCYFTVNVVPVVDQTEQPIDKNDLVYQTFRAGGPGGQHQNTTDSAVRVVHKPTSIAAIARNTPSQHQNRRIATNILLAKLAAHYEAQRADPTQRATRDSSVVRSYETEGTTFVRDHRITGDERRATLDAYFKGNALNGFIDAYHDQLLLERLGKK